MNLTETREATIKVVSEAGAILKKYFETRDFTDKSKGGLDFVTQADEEVDRFLIERLKAVFPQSDFLTEESAPDDYSSLLAAENLVVIDPLDGTTNFSRNDPNFGISVGWVRRGIPKLGVIYLPVSNRMYWAEEDQDVAFLNGQRIHVSSTSELKRAVIATDWPHDLSKRKITVDWQRVLSNHVRQIKVIGSAVCSLASLAQGDIDAFLHPGLKPWDIAAGSLLVEKAGGRVNQAGGDLNWNIFDVSMLASNNILHDPISKIIIE